MLKKGILFCTALLFWTMAAVNAQAARPEWVSSPQKFCTMNEICVLGSGATLNHAKADAQNEVLKVFETNVKSSFKNTLAQKNNEALKELTTEEVESMAEGVVSGVKIKQTYEEKGTFYVFSVLNKPEMAKNLQMQIADVDEQIMAFYKDGTPSSNAKLRGMFPYREALNRRYAFLNKGEGIKAPVSYEEAFAQKKTASAGKIVALKVEEDGGSRVRNDLRKLLAEQGYKVSSAGATVSIEGTLTKEEEHIAIEGFEKYTYTLELECKDAEGKNLGTLSVSVTETGRSERQAYTKALPQMMDYVKENISDLSL